VELSVSCAIAFRCFDWIGRGLCRPTLRYLLAP